MSSGGALVVVPEVGFIGLLHEVTAVLVEEDAGKAIAIVDVDEEAAEDVEAQQSGDFDASSVTLGRDIKGHGVGGRELSAGETEGWKLDRAGDLEQGSVGRVNVGAGQIGATLSWDHFDDGAGDTAD